MPGDFVEFFYQFLVNRCLRIQVGKQAKDSMSHRPVDEPKLVESRRIGVRDRTPNDNLIYSMVKGFEFWKTSGEVSQDLVPSQFLWAAETEYSYADILALPVGLKITVIARQQ